MTTHARRAIPGKKKGGARKGAGRKSATEESVRAYHALEKIRTSGVSLTEEEKALLAEARETLLGVMRNPGRYAQQKIVAAKHFIEEIAGKVPDQVDANVRSMVVEVVKATKPGEEAQAAPIEVPVGANIIPLKGKEPQA